MADDDASKRAHDERALDERDECAAQGAALPKGLYLVATPIGAAADITLRALDILRRADAIAAEDTRRARHLLDIHGVPLAGRPLTPYHDHNGAAQRPGLLARVARGQAVALVSDAGTPLVADPGWKLAQEAIARGLPVTAAPGASALLAALSVAGLPTDRFLFAGFPPTKAGERARFLADLAATPATLVFYESPRRVDESLEAMRAALGDRPAALCRELTKKFEQTRRGPLSDLIAGAAADPPRGEIVIVVGPPSAAAATEADIDAALAEALAGASVRDAARDVAERLGAPRKAVYQRALALAGKG
jgi:16S rRNA (cytidine1402-2'-O)-methyltransferase